MSEQKLREALQEAVRIASDENGEVFGGNLIARETAIVKWKQQAREALQPPTSEGTPLPDCMMPDGAEPCKGYQKLERTLRAKERELADAKAELAFVSAFADPPDMTTGKTVRAELGQELDEAKHQLAALQSASAAPQEGKPAMKRFYELCESFRKNESDGNMYRKLESLYFDVAQELDILRATPMGDGDEKVICPECCHQFRAIPIQVQNLMLDAGFEPPFTAPPAATDGFIRVPDTKIDLSEDELMDVLKKTSPYMTEKQYKALTVTRWKDSIDVDYPNEAFRILAHFVLLAAAPQSGKEEDGWFPIDTAPKDGSEFVTCNMNQGGVKRLISWNRIHGHWQSKGEHIYLHETHWAPLPSPPSKAEGE